MCTVRVPTSAGVPALILAGAFAAIALIGSPAAADDAGAPSALPACIQVSTDARYVPYGYNHVVILKNGCSRAATCSVATDVNPLAITTEVASASTVEVLTFSGSPAQAFRAKVACALH